ncbi:hypothetical protein ACFP6A_05980 [Quadrisphaera sp. GCM10027208]|uniref:hypothetical protein n=1 Tax=Quadrisphaera sp. GCM10027208 TaxID=3273423 RepID=UPI00360A7C43
MARPTRTPPASVTVADVPGHLLRLPGSYREADVDEQIVAERQRRAALTAWRRRHDLEAGWRALAAERRRRWPKVGR